jgi:phosphoribosylformylglycinamidine synthase
VVEAPPPALADAGPVNARPRARPRDLAARQAAGPGRLPRPATGDELRATLLRLAGSPNLADKRWVTDQYDRYVQGNTVLAAPDDAGVVRLAESGAGVALALDGNGRYTRLDPYAGAQLALAEACRNVAAVGAVPVAATDCLNFGSPEDPEVMWQFAEAVRGLADGCAALGTPVIGGNVSFYNQTGDVAINPTPVVGILGVLDDVARRTPLAFSAEGDTLLLLGTTGDDFGGSEWAWEVHRHLGGTPPPLDLAAEKALGEILVAASRDGMLTAAHDLSDGGLAQALVESCVRGGRGARIVPPEGADPFVWLFSESASRAVVAVPRSEELRFTEMCAARSFPCARIGVVVGDALEVQGQFTVPLAELRTAWEGTLPRLFG